MEMPAILPSQNFDAVQNNGATISVRFAFVKSEARWVVDLLEGYEAGRTQWHFCNAGQTVAMLIGMLDSARFDEAVASDMTRVIESIQKNQEVLMTSAYTFNSADCEGG